jgi:CubicO group peptidase (beta-lactamase class C family)
MVNAFADEVRSALAESLEAQLAPPRYAVSIVRDGLVEQFHGQEADQHTRFRIASMTKSFTAAAVLQLRDSGTWKLDDPVSRWIPETLALRGPTSDSPAITLRHLVTMSAGMSTDDPWADRFLDLDAAGFRSVMSAGALFACIPGTAMEYSNLGFALLGEAIARATLLSPQRYITANILTPLGMDATTWDTPVGHDFAQPHHRHQGLDVGEPLADGAFAPMGGLWSTIADLAKWVGFLADAFPARDGEDSDVLVRASRREMQQVHTGSPISIRETPRGARLSLIGYGMGLMIGEHTKLGKVISHSGGLPGYGSNMRWVPSAGVGVVGLSNRTYTPMSAVTNELLERFSGDVFANTDRRWDNSKALERELRSLATVLFESPEDLATYPFAINVALDLPLDRRVEAARAAADEVGKVDRWSFVAETAAAGTLTGQSATHTVTLSGSLAPLPIPQIQKYDLQTAALPSKDRMVE